MNHAVNNLYCVFHRVLTDDSWDSIVLSEYNVPAVRIFNCSPRETRTTTWCRVIGLSVIGSLLPVAVPVVVGKGDGQCHCFIAIGV